MAPSKEEACEISLATIRETVQHIAELLPSQAPLDAFVHHNTLHAFEDLDFHDAVQRASKLFNRRPYLDEESFRIELERGRIRTEDIEEILNEEVEDPYKALPLDLGTRYDMMCAILEYPLHDGPNIDLSWVLSETNALTAFRPETSQAQRERIIAGVKKWLMRDLGVLSADDLFEKEVANLPRPVRSLVRSILKKFSGDKIDEWSEAKWEKVALHLLWGLCKHGESVAHLHKEHAIQDLSSHELLEKVSHVDSVGLVNSVLIRFCSLFIDQGFSGWHLPWREEGFFRCFLELYGDRTNVFERWQRDVRRELLELKKQGTSAEESLQKTLAEFGVTNSSLESFLQKSLLDLSGFAGMINQLEKKGSDIYNPLAEGTIVEYLAVRLLLEKHALLSVARSQLDFSGTIGELRAYLIEHSSPPTMRAISLRDTYRLFEIAQILQWDVRTLAKLNNAQWEELMEEVVSFDTAKRKKIYHLAYEKKFREHLFDSIILHRRILDSHTKTQKEKERPSFQIMCCIDDREESFRRYMEEIDAKCETFGTAGFFGVAMYYQGASDAHYAPLCPGSIQPRHYIQENASVAYIKSARERKKRRRAIGTITQKAHFGSFTFTAGWIGTATLGALATFPLVARVLFPRASAKLRNLIGDFIKAPEITQVSIERYEEPPGPENGHRGFTVEEMADVVQGVLRSINLTRNFSKLIILCGHGSSSLNNPHEAAYNCGACAGGRGGPNARVFARMANDYRVRSILKDRGIVLPTDTHFVGAYHNTCDESVAYYELEHLPGSHIEAFEHASSVIDEARASNAQERCRRFHSSPLTITAEQALAHVEARSEDLSQPRPEYNHATNGICLVGRRFWSKGLFLDRRSFLQSYDPGSDNDSADILEGILSAVIPVCAGINLEYYFSCIDTDGYGCGNKLPHNITSLLGVMEGTGGDLRPGLYQQMIEIHEPLRIVFVIETTVRNMKSILDRNKNLGRLVYNNWVQLALLDPDSAELSLYYKKEFVPYTLRRDDISTAVSSRDWHRGWRGNLEFASIAQTFEREELQ